MSPWFDPEGRLRVGWRVLLGVLVALIANFVAIDFAVSFTRQPRGIEAIYRPLCMVLLLAGFSGLLLAADRVTVHPLVAMGLGLIRRWQMHILVGIGTAAAMVCAAVIAIIATGHISVGVALNGRTLGLALLEVLILASGAMSEELMFRGYPFQRLVEALGSAGAVCIFAFLFGLVHLQNPHSSAWALVNTVAIGVLLSITYLRTRSLWMPWGIHFGWNTVLGLVFGLPVSGLTDFSVIVKSRALGPKWLTGGAYGIEGGALGTIVIVLGLLPMLWFTRNGRFCAEPVADGRALSQPNNAASGSADHSSNPGIQL